MTPTSHESILIIALFAALGLASCGDARPDDKLQGVPPPPVAELTPAATALQGANIPTLDPATMADAEIGAVIGAGPRCEFRYTRSGHPVLAFAGGLAPSAGAGVVKLNGKLVPLRRRPSADAGFYTLDAENLTLSIAVPDESLAEDDLGRERVEARMVFELREGQGLEVGYGGYFSCPVQSADEAA